MTGAGRHLAFCSSRHGLFRWVLVAVIPAITSWGRVAHASNTWDPTGDRMAWTDRSTAVDIQPRIWLLTNGSLGNPGRLLMTRRPDLNQNGWLNLQIGGLDTGLDAVSWNASGTQYQRVFYVKNGEIFMLTYDNDVPGGSVQITSFLGTGTSIVGTDLGAITFAAGAQHIAVAAGATVAAPRRCRARAPGG